MHFRLIGKAEEVKYNQFIAAASTGNIFQTYFWGEVKKPAWQPIRAVLEEDSRIVAAALILKRQIPLMRRPLFYLPRGPVLKDWHDPAALENMLRGLLDLAAEHRAVFIKVDPLLEEGRGAAELLSRHGFIAATGHRDFGGLQPRYTFRLDLEGEVEQIMNRFPKKIRYKIRYGPARGLEFSSGGEEALPEFMEIMDQTAARGDFVARDAAYYRRLFHIMGPAGAIDLTLGRFQGETVVAGITFAFGDKAWAVYGGQSDSHRNIYAYHALIWERIKWAKSKGVRWFDFFGVPGELDEKDPLYGIYYFKKSFGGEYCAYIGEQDLVLSRGYYGVWRWLYPPLYDLLIGLLKAGRRVASAFSRKGRTSFSAKAPSVQKSLR